MASRAINKELKQKLESHKKWLEEQITSNENDSRDMSHSRNPEDALDEIANNSVQLGTYKPVYPSDENRQQFGRPDEDIFDRHEEKRPKTTNSNRKSPKQEGERASSQYSSKSGVKKCSSMATPVRQKRTQSPKSQEKYSEPDENHPDRIEFYGRLSGDKRLDELLLRNKKTLENKKLLMAQKKPDNLPDEECTFKPKTNPRPAYKKLLPFEERNKLWISQKTETIEKMKKKDEDKDLRGCTFHPDINYNPNWNVNPEATALASKGTDKFLRRQLIARQLKEEKDTILNNPLAKISTTTNKQSQKFTIPRSPFFGAVELEEKTLNSLKKPLEPQYLEEYSSAKLRISDQSKRDSPERAREEKYAQRLYHIMDQKSPDYLKGPSITYGKAVNLLHKQLARMEITYDG